MNSSYNTKRHYSYSSYSFFFFLGLFYLLFFFYIYCYTDTTNFTLFSQLLRCQFFISQNNKIYMKLWPATTKNKCFVKMFWHLLDECVKATVLLVCSIRTSFFFIFFSIIDLCSFFLYITARMCIQCFCAIHLQCHFVKPLCLLFFFFFFF